MSQQKSLTLVAFGDSITQASSELPDELQRWPAILEQALCVAFPASPVTVINAGIGGNTSREGLARIENDVLRHRPDCVLVEFGGNDATPEPERHVTLDEYAANLAAMKARLDALGGCRMVLVTFPPVLDLQHAWQAAFKDVGGQDRYLERYRRVTRDFAARHGLPLADIDAALRPKPTENTLPDGVHLTAAGNRVVAETVLGVVVSCCGETCS